MKEGVLKRIRRKGQYTVSYTHLDVYKRQTQSRENAPWYQHEELGYNYRMSNVIAGVVRGQFPYLEEHIAQQKAIYER